MDKQYIGQVVRAKTLDQVEDPHYKLRALIETGDLKGRECLVCHRGSPDTLMKDLVIRLDQLPNQEPANLDGMVTGFFVTSHVPQGFEYSAPRDVLLYGVWQNR
ncbi:hypothetical protein KY360_01810, partial [Candidatus Woesearchaeota archaeon]|nr:hypothetical protein [Candidatus Woesearchaeota archaeon]